MPISYAAKLWEALIAKTMRMFWIFLALVLATSLGAFVWYYRPRHIEFPWQATNQPAVGSGSNARVFVPHRALAGEIAQFDDALFAFLMFDYLRGRPPFEGRPLLLTTRERAGQTRYVLQLRLPDDLVEGVDILAKLKAQRLTSDVRLRWLLPRQLKTAFEETAVFMRAYDGPADRRLKEYRTPELQAICGASFVSNPLSILESAANSIRSLRR